MAKRGTPARWVPPMTEKLLNGRGVKNACLEAGLDPSTIRKLYTSERQQLANVLKWLSVLGFTDDEPVMQVLKELGGQNGGDSATIVLGSTPKPSKTFSESDPVANSDTDTKDKSFALLRVA